MRTILENVEIRKLDTIGGEHETCSGPMELGQKVSSIVESNISLQIH